MAAANSGMPLLNSTGELAPALLELRSPRVAAANAGMSLHGSINKLLIIHSLGNSARPCSLLLALPCICLLFPASARICVVLLLAAAHKKSHAD
jgi:hypothetical protein